jgi:hypothetical protein
MLGGLVAEVIALTANVSADGAVSTVLLAAAPLMLLLPPQAANMAAARISDAYSDAVASSPCVECYPPFAMQTVAGQVTGNTGSLQEAVNREDPCLECSNGTAGRARFGWSIDFSQSRRCGIISRYLKENSPRTGCMEAQDTWLRQAADLVGGVCSFG